jgi:hypothetical protein
LPTVAGTPLTLVGAIRVDLRRSIMPRKTAAKTAKGNGKAKGKATQAAETEKRDNRYLRASRAILAAGETDGLDPIYLAMKADMSQSTAGHCIEAYKGVCAALREFKLLPVKRAPRQKRL